MNAPDRHHVLAGIEYSREIAKAAARSQREEEAVSDKQRAIKDALYLFTDECRVRKAKERDYAPDLLSQMAHESDELIGRMCNLIRDASVGHGPHKMPSDQVGRMFCLIVADAIEQVAKYEAEQSASGWGEDAEADGAQ